MRYRVLRGGPYLIDSWYLLATYRNWNEPEVRSRFIGFRVVVVRRKP